MARRILLRIVGRTGRRDENGPAAIVQPRMCWRAKSASTRPRSRPNAMAATPARTATPKNAAYPDFRSQRALERGEHSAARQQTPRPTKWRRRRRRPAAERRCVAGAFERGSGQDQAENRSGAGSPEQSRGNAEQQRAERAWVGTGRRRLRKPAAQVGRRAGRADRPRPAKAASIRRSPAQPEQQRGRIDWRAPPIAPPTVAIAANAANVTAMPASRGSPLLRKG